jgi:hypothetical protein
MENGIGGYTGEREHYEYAAGASTYSTWQLELTREIPGGVGFNILGQGPRQGPLIFRKVGDTWQDLNGTYNALPGSTPFEVMNISVMSKPSGVVLGVTNEDAAKIFATLYSGGSYIITVGVREPAPLMVSWKRDATQWVRDTARSLVVNCPKLETWLVSKGTVAGVNINTGELITAANDYTIGNLYGKDNIKIILALLKAYYSVPARSLTWKDGGVIDTDSTSRPGRLVTSATIDNGVSPVTINAVVTRRSWDFTPDGYGTFYDTERLMPDVQAIL